MDIKQSKKGEKLAKEYIKSQGWKIKDVSDNPTYWKKDIDLLAFKDGEKTSIEVKWDDKINRTGNMFIELSTDILNKKDGWIHFTEADYIFYGDANRNMFYIFTPEQMREYLKTHTKDIGIIYARDKRENKISIGALVKPSDYGKYYHLSLTENFKSALKF